MGDSRIVIPVIIGIMILGSIGFNQEAFAATIESNGSGGGDWNDASTWFGGIIPTANDEVIILSGDIVTLTDFILFNSGGKITVEDGAELIIDGTLGGLLQSEGSIINSGVITLKGGSDTLSGSLFSSGIITNWGIIYLIGDSGGNSANLSSTGEIINSGEILSDAGRGTFSGRIFNGFIFKNECTGIVTMNGGPGFGSSIFSNGGFLENNGIMTFNGGRFGAQNASLNNLGAVTNHNTIIFNPGQARDSGVLLGSPIVDDPIPCPSLVEQVAIDIKPGSDPNAIQPFQMGVTPVVIFSSSTFSSETVDFSTITFGPDEATPVHKKPHFEDVNNDGLIDMVVHFKTKEIGIEQDTMELCLMAQTLDGTSIEGCDSIMVVPKV